MRKTVTGILVGGAILTWLLAQVDLLAVGAVLGNASIPFLLTSLGLKVGVAWIKSARWAVVLRNATGGSIRRTFSASMIGFAGNVIFPGRMGEIARVMVIDKHNRTGLALALATVVFIQMLDLLCLTIGLVMACFWATNLMSNRVWPVIIPGIMIPLILFCLAKPRAGTGRPTSPLSRFYGLMPQRFHLRVAGNIRRFSRGFTILGRGAPLFLVLILTAGVWSFEILAALLMIIAFHIPASVPMAALWIVAVNLSFAFPVSPGNVGVVQAISVFLLGIFGVSEASALAYSIGNQGATCLVIVGLGMFLFYRERMDLGKIKRTLGHAGAPGRECKEKPWPT